MSRAFAAPGVSPRPRPRRSSSGQIERDRSPGSEAGDRLEQPIGVLGQHRTDESQGAGSQEIHLHPAIVGRSATPGKARIKSRWPAAWCFEDQVSIP